MIAIYYEHRCCVWVVLHTVFFRKCSHRVGRSRVEGTCPQGKQSLTRKAGSCSQKWVAECLWHEESGEWNWFYKNSTGQLVKHCETDPCAETLKCTLPKGLGMSKRISEAFTWCLHVQLERKDPKVDLVLLSDYVWHELHVGTKYLPQDLFATGDKDGDGCINQEEWSDLPGVDSHYTYYSSETRHIIVQEKKYDKMFVEAW